MKRIIPALLLVLVLCGGAWGATYYVDATSGNDSWDGLAGAYVSGTNGPWKTLGKLNTFETATGFADDDVISLKRGEVWYEQLQLNWSGSSGHPIILTSYSTGDKPVIHGGTEITGWAGPDGNGCYTVAYSGGSVYGFSQDNQLLPVASDATCGDGNWFFDDPGDTIYYKPDSGVPGDYTIHRIARVQGIVFWNATGGDNQYITISNIKFLLHYRGIVGSSANGAFVGITIDSCEFDQCSSATLIEARNGNNTSGLSLTNNIVTYCSRGLYFGSYSSGAETSTSCTVTGNTITGTGYIDATNPWDFNAETDTEGMGLQNINSCTISQNEINGPGTEDGGISVWVKSTSVADGNTISRNYIHDLDGCGILWGGEGTDTSTGNAIFSNIIESCGGGSSPPYGGLRLNRDQDPGNMIYNNTLYANDVNIYLYSLTDNWVVKNNISLSPTTYHVRRDGVIGSNALDYNLYYPDGADKFSLNSTEYNFSDWKTNSSQDANSPTPADPLFVNAAGGDFTLQAGSPCINAGLIGDSIDNDDIRISGVDGTAFVDLGAGTLLTEFLDGKVVLIDSGSDEMIGYIKAAGTGETYDSELFTDPSFEAVTKAAAKTVTGITKANPGVVTFDTGHGYVDGDIIYFSGLTEMTELNTEYWQLRSNAGDTFELATVYDTTSLDTSGYGSAETTGGSCAQKVTFTNWSVAYPTWVVGVDGAGALTNAAVNVGSGANQSIYESITATEDWLMRLTTVCDALTAGTYGGYVAAQYLAFTAANDVDTLYWYGTFSSDTRNNGITARDSLAASFTDVSLKHVLTPAATGVTIVSESGGSTYNWASKDGDFSYNDAGNYTYKIYPATDYAGNPIVGELDIGAYEYQGGSSAFIMQYYLQ